MAAASPARSLPAWPARLRPNLSAALPPGLLAALAYLPLLVTAPARVGADTKQYLYLDPGRLLGRAVSMWDPHVGMGTVTHQTIGYLFPMGPWYWLFDRLGAPDWLAQRLWLGTILFAAGAGVLFLARTMGLRGLGPLVAALAYMLTPYVLHYAARISAILLPWAALPWLVGLAARGLRRGGWRHPALFALVVALVGGVNATALAYVGLGPLLWFPYAVFVLGEASPRRAVGVALRTGLLSALVSLWWVAGLWAQAGYGMPVLRYTETVEAVARTSLASEVLRGLGYWFFYGTDKLGPWIEPAVDYTQLLWLILAGFALATLAVLAAFSLRWAPRSYFVGLVVVGTIAAVGAHPFAHPSPLGTLFKAAATGSTAGLALRSTGRAVPLVVLGLAVLLGAGVSALHRVSSLGGLVAAGLAGALVVAGLPPLWKGTTVAKNLQRPEELPRYWDRAAAFLDQRGPDTRVLEIPGSDFAAYRWGNTVDPVTPGLIDRPYVARELVPQGSPAAADLLAALDRRLQEGVLEPAALAPVARLMAVGDVVHRADLQYERYNTPRPRPTHRLLDPPPAGLRSAAGFGRPRPDHTVRFPMVDELALAVPPGSPHPPPVSVLAVDSPRHLVRAETADRPLVLAGDGEGVVDAAAAGLLAGPLDHDRALLYAASLTGDRPALRRALDAGADLVLTDTNRRRARRWGTVRENAGYTEQAGEEPLVTDLGDARLEVFPSAGDDAFTLTEQRGVARVQASGYGNPVSYTPEDRPARAFDGDLLTAWRVAAFSEAVGQRLVLELPRPVETDRLVLVQPLTGPRDRFVTRASLRLDGGPLLTVDLGPASRRPEGQEVGFARRPVRRVEFRVEATNVGRRASYLGTSAVGLAELRLGDQRVDEMVRLPTDLLAAVGARSLSHRLMVLLSRARSLPVPPRADEELALARTFALPTGRSFSLSGTARIHPYAPDEVIDQLLASGGPRAAQAGGETGRGVARSSARIAGNLGARAASALDGDPATAWAPPLGHQDGHWLEYELPHLTVLDRLELVVVTDGRHSVPTRLRVETDSGQARVVEVPAVQDRGPEGATASAPVRFEPLAGRRVRVTVEQVRPVRTVDYYSERPILLPVGIAELGPTGVRVTGATEGVPAGFGCRFDLLAVDGHAVGLRVIGDRATAEAGGPLRVEPCGAEAGPAGLGLGPGSHAVRARPGRETGIDLDRLVLGSEPGGSPQVGSTGPGGESSSDLPRVEVREARASSTRVRVRGANAPFWLVLGQSHNRGWRAVDDRGRSLGRPVLVDGYANGWYVEPSRPDFEITMEWAPQRWVWAALAASAIAGLLCAALVLASRRCPSPSAAEAGQRAGRGRRSSQPRLASPLVSGGGRPGPAAVVLGSLAVLAGGATVAGPAVGMVAGAVTLAALVLAPARAVLAAGSVGGVLLAGLYTTVQQYRYRHPPQFEWPTHFEWAHRLAWLGVVLLAADVVVGWLRDRAAASAQPVVAEGFAGQSPQGPPGRGLPGEATGVGQRRRSEAGP